MSLSCSTALSIAKQDPGTYPSFHILSISLCGQPGEQKSLFSKFSLFLLIFISLIVWPRFGDPFVSKTPRGICVSHSPDQMLRCAYTICSICTILSWSACPRPRLCLVLCSFWANLLHSLIITINHSLELFTSALADGFSQEFEWQQVSSRLQDSS